MLSCYTSTRVIFYDRQQSVDPPPPLSCHLLSAMKPPPTAPHLLSAVANLTFPFIVDGIFGQNLKRTRHIQEKEWFIFEKSSKNIVSWATKVSSIHPSTRQNKYAGTPGTPYTRYLMAAYSRLHIGKAE